MSKTVLVQFELERKGLQMTESETSTLNKAKRRRGPRHPGVRLKRPDPDRRMPYWRAIYVDPDKGKKVYERLDPDLYPTDEARKQWAVRKSFKLRERRIEIEDGARKATGEGFDELIKLFLDSNVNLREGTLDEYRRTLGVFGRWAREHNKTPDNITRADLVAFRAWAMKLPKKQAARGKKGTSIELEKRRSLITVNGDLRVTGTLLTWLITAERLPRLHLDDLVVGLKKYPVDFQFPEYMTRRKIRRSLLCAMRHDAAVFEMTREEKKRLGERTDSEKGSTARYTPIAPFLACAFLAGMRLDELCLIEWRIHIDLDHEDLDGIVIGQIKLRAEDTKTHRARFVSFEVSPMLRELILALQKKTGGKGSVFGVTYDEAQAANRRLREDFKAPAELTYQMARSTCSTYLTNAPGIYGSAASFHSAKQLGHSQAVQEKHYAGLVKGIRPDIKTVEAAMQIEDEVRMIIDIVKGKPVSIPEDDEAEAA